MRNDRLFLADIVDSIEAIERFTTGIDETCFVADELIQSAVLQKLSVIGEAAGRLTDETRTHAADVPWKEIIGFRNIAVHAYFSVDWRAVFVTVTDDLPMLKHAVATLLKISPTV
ncbi:MAG: DUF86 domain-containing protein [Gammaproteobacteria bacterium]|nr:DUF86 domain-containing protein [Gammaproteobacteria bacterium]MBU1646013.1 DUF86 domain-containing protein [Gammaproteobacteria bacterium]MBU1972075.1 DUF86 domain-containing protein [Gammaproteobacteria bacterium]